VRLCCSQLMRNNGAEEKRPSHGSIKKPRSWKELSLPLYVRVEPPHPDLLSKVTLPSAESGHGRAALFAAVAQLIVRAIASQCFVVSLAFDGPRPA